MNTKKNFAILFLLMAISICLVSCSQDDDFMHEVATIDSLWREPYHIKGASPDEVKSFMKCWKNDLTMSERSSLYGMQLAYSRENSEEGILYSFSVVDGGLYSVIDTEPIKNYSIILDYFMQHYEIVSGSTEQQYIFTNTDKVIVITLGKSSAEFFNLTYDFVSR